MKDSKNGLYLNICTATFSQFKYILDKEEAACEIELFQIRIEIRMTFPLQKKYTVNYIETNLYSRNDLYNLSV